VPDFRALLVGDIHLSDRPPASCTDEYLEDLFTILEHSVEKAEELQVSTVIWAGDVFHHKQPSRTSHKTVQRAIEIVQAYRHLLIVPGNHDMLADRFDSIYETQPLGILLQSGAELLRGWHDEYPVYGVPWLQQWTDGFVGQALNDFRSGGPSRPGDANKAGLVVAHAPLYPPGLENPFEYYSAESWADRMGNAGYCYYGHVHDAHGEYEAKGVQFCNQGAITRGSLQESDLKRVIRLTTWDYPTRGDGFPEGGFQAVDVPHKPADQVFRLMERREIQDTQARLDDFLSSIDQTSLEITSISAVMDHIRTLGLGVDIEKAIENLLTESEK
jgi:hypothetical protein